MVAIAVGGAGILWIGAWIAQSHAEPEGNLILKGLSGWQWMLFRQRDPPLHIIA